MQVPMQVNRRRRDGEDRVEDREECCRELYGGEAAGGQRRGRQRQGGKSVPRGVWVDPAMQQVGNIAELDPGAFAFGRG